MNGLFEKLRERGRKLCWKTPKDGAAIRAYLRGCGWVASLLTRRSWRELTTDTEGFEVMNEKGIVLSGDALTLGIGAMTDARWASFYKTMTDAGVFPAGIDLKKAYSLEFINKGVGKA